MFYLVQGNIFDKNVYKLTQAPESLQMPRIRGICKLFVELKVGLTVPILGQMRGHNKGLGLFALFQIQSVLILVRLVTLEIEIHHSPITSNSA